jgi:integrase
MSNATSQAEYLNAKPRAKEYTISDGKFEGLQMVVTPSGSKQWEFRYRLNGRRRKISILGGYPKVGVAKAREWAELWTDLVGSGKDPFDHRREEAAKERAKRDQKIHTFRAVASDWLEAYALSKPLSPISRHHIQSKFDNDVFPVFGDRQVGDVTEAEVERLVCDIAKQGKIDKAYRVLWHCRGAFAWAVEKGLAPKDPTFNKEKRLPPLHGGNRAAVLEPEQVGKLLRDIAACGSGISTRYALRILPLVFTRPSELREAKWSEIDLDRALWDIPAERMKGPINKRRSHLVPLSRQVLDILRRLREENEESEYVFPSPQTPRRPISDMAMLKAVRTMGYTSKEQSVHGFRAIARTLLDERLRFPFHVIEAQLAHAVKDANGTAYNRTQYLEARREMMQAWADYLDKLERGEG